MEIQKNVREIVAHFFPEEELKCLESYGNGHINSTFLIERETQDGSQKYILQKINTDVFQEPDKLMENIRHVTEYLKTRIQENGGDPNRETLNMVPTDAGALYYQDTKGNCWRVYQFIDHAFCYDLVEKAEDFYESGLAFGNFQRLLSKFPAEKLHETIPQFHDTQNRYLLLMDAVERNPLGRAAAVEAEIAFAKERYPLARKLVDLQKKGLLPLRVTHNDTKLNNIMIDEFTGKGLCVIDLDTVMPGLSVHDFGDSIRFGANTAYEDERDLSKVSCDLGLFEAYTRGFLEGVAGSLTDMEIQMLTTGAMAMTYECGIRFLTDYLEGDVYFKTHRKNHNLDRARCQFALVRDMEDKEAQMDAIVRKYQQ